MARPDLLGKFMFNPYYVSHFKEYYRILASGLVHTGWWHLLFNMITLYFIGNLVEGAFVGIYGSLLGRIIYLVFYLLALIVSSISDLMKYRDNVSYYFCGSSGAVSAVMFASVIIFPKISFYLFFIPIPVPGYVYALLFLLYCCYCCGCYYFPLYFLCSLYHGDSICRRKQIKQVPHHYYSTP
jgi:membrane associated rhomboid family serine protease